MALPRDEFIPTRRSLLTRLKHWDDQRGWQDFFDTYGKLLHSVARRAGFNDADAQDVVQETILAVARHMPEFRYDPAIGSFKSWLLTILRRRMADRFRKRRREPLFAEPGADQDSKTPLLERMPDPAGPEFERIWEAEWERHVLEAALRTVRRQVAAKQFQIFDCYALKGWSVAEVVKNLHVTEQQVYLAKHRVSALLKEQLHQLDTRML